MNGGPKAYLIITGSELTRGETKDINGPFLGTELTLHGIQVEEIHLIPDDPAKLEECFRRGAENADIVLVSGGLGPTADDHPVHAVAKAFGKGVVRDADAAERMRARVLQRVGSDDKIPSNFFKQAEVVEGATVLPNPVGLAPGSLVETERGVLAVLPGVPREMRAMFREHVLPAIHARFEIVEPRIFRAKIIGVGESWAEQRIQALGIQFDRLEYGISARPGELLVKILAHRAEAHPLVDTARQLLEKEFGEAMIPLPEGLVDGGGDPFDVDHARIVHKLLLGNRYTVATAESCTGGLLAKYLTDHPGSSSYFLGSIVAYDNTIKQKLLGVDEQLLAKHGAVSAEVCDAMARSAKERFGADYGIGVTGIAGPDGGSEEKPVGLVYVSAALPNDASQNSDDSTIVCEHRFFGHRPVVRHQAAVHALEIIRRDVIRRTGDTTEEHRGTQRKK